MIDPERERRRVLAAQQQADNVAKAGMNAPGADMVAVFAIAGFELADIFAEWLRRWDALLQEQEGAAFDDPRAMAAVLNGLGPPQAFMLETPEQFGQRVARAILQLLKEV